MAAVYTVYTSSIQISNRLYFPDVTLNRFDTMSINTIPLISLRDVDLQTQTYNRVYLFTCYMYGRYSMWPGWSTYKISVHARTH